MKQKFSAISVRFGKPNRTREFGLSLLELLVVIVILGILIAIIIPVTGRIQASVRNTECISNLRQIGLAMNSYATEHNGVYPYAFNSTHNPNSAEKQKTWMRKLAPYVEIPENVMGPAPQLRSTGIFDCPEWKHQPDWSASKRYVSYGISRYIDSYTAPQNNRYWEYRLTSVPAKTILVAEVDVASEFAYAERIIRRHPNESANYLFVDGHVENLTEIIPASDPRWCE